MPKPPTFDDLWAELCNAQPRLRDGSEHIVFTVDVFHQLMRKAYYRGKAYSQLKQDTSIGDVIDSLKEGIVRSN